MTRRFESLQSLTGSSETEDVDQGELDSVVVFNPSQVRLKPLILGFGIRVTELFNPSQVRLKHSNYGRYEPALDFFNPSQVRLKPLLASRGSPFTLVLQSLTGSSETRIGPDRSA